MIELLVDFNEVIRYTIKMCVKLQDKSGKYAWTTYNVLSSGLIWHRRDEKKMICFLINFEKWLRLLEELIIYEVSQMMEEALRE